MPDCTKVPYHSAREAARALARIQAKRRAVGQTTPVAVHPCVTCAGRWHVTSKRVSGTASRRWQTFAGLG